MKIVFAGTPQFSVPTLQALIDSAHDVVAVLTQPDRKQGRGQTLQPSPIKQLATSYDIPVMQPLTLKDPEIQQTLLKIDCDLMVVVAYGLLLPKAILSWPKHGCINVHASLLPRWRGASPIQHAIMMGDQETGVAIMQMDEGMDTGAVYTQACVTIGDMNAHTLGEALSTLGAKTLLEVFDAWPVKAHPQSEHGITHAPKLKKQDAIIDWSRPASEIANRIRAFYPWPMATTEIHGKRVSIEHAVVLSTATDQAPGTILSHDEGLDVACGVGCLRILRAQVAGKRRMDWAEMRRGYAMLWPIGSRFTKG